MHRRGPDDRGADARDPGLVLADRAPVRRHLDARARRHGLRPHHQQVPPSVSDQGRLCLRAALHRRALDHLLRHRRAARPCQGQALRRPHRAAQAFQRALPGARFTPEAPHHRGMAGSLRQGRHPRHAGAHAGGAVRRSAFEGDRLLHRARASDRRADHDLRQPARFREDQGRVPPPCAAHRRRRRGGAARGGA